MRTHSPSSPGQYGHYKGMNMLNAGGLLRPNKRLSLGGLAASIQTDLHLILEH